MRTFAPQLKSAKISDAARDQSYHVRVSAESPVLKAGLPVFVEAIVRKGHLDPAEFRLPGRQGPADRSFACSSSLRKIYRQTEAGQSVPGTRSRRRYTNHWRAK